MQTQRYFAVALVLLAFQWMTSAACLAVPAVEKDRATKAVLDYLATIQGDTSGRGPQLKEIHDDTLHRLFPDHVFFGLKYGRDAAGPDPASPLRRSNLFAVGDDGAVKLIASKGALQEFFGLHVPGVTTDERAKETVYCWLRLAEELSYSGSYEFSIPVDSIAVHRTPEELRAAGKAVLRFPSGKTGQIGATLTFDNTGALTRVQEASIVEPVAAGTVR